MIGFPVGLLYSNAGEWFIHRYLLHARGKHRESIWSFHWHEHHRESRLHDFKDTHYQRSIWGWHAQGKEALGVLCLAAAHVPLFPFAPFFTGAVWYSAWNYHRVHKRSHMDPQWARANLPWHYDHHMGPNQNANWCVTKPWFDHLMGTREPYIGTEKERSRMQKSRARSESARC